jgi:hypothetical protein
MHMNLPELDVSFKRPLHAQPDRRVTSAVSEEGAVTCNLLVNIQIWRRFT